ncbi:MAG TPA: ABC transporter permease [Candidatus Acidoferrum sp.]|nr:ABC transporter permease [Candidatus Acidoferrum sp.]
MRILLQDIRFAFRQFLKSPGFAVSCVLSLMLGIGATTAIFSVVYGILLDPYPYKDAARMIHVELRDKNDRGPLLIVNGTEAKELRSASSVDDFFLQDEKRENLTGEKFPVSVQVGLYSPNLFEFMGVPPLIGREFTPADAPGGNPAPVAVLGYLFWQRQFGASRGVLGKMIELDDTPYTVIGVVPQRFTWGDSDVYLPAVPDANPHHYWNAFLKLKPGVKYAAAQAEMQVFVDRFSRENPKGYPQNVRAKVVSLNEEVLGRFTGTIIFLFGAVIILLAIGCANVSILLLARGAARQHEFAVRASIGAGRARLIRQLLTESVLLAAAGAALGVLAAFWGVKALSSMLPYYSFPHEAAIRVNAIVLIFSAAIAVLTGVLFGLSPALQLSRPQSGPLIQSSGARLAGSTRSRNTHRFLIAGQVALTLLLLAGAGGAVRAFEARIHTPLGFNPDHVIALDVDLPKGANSTWLDRLNQNELIRQAVAQSPGVAEAGVSTTWFPGFGGFNAKIEIQSKPTLTDAQAVLSLISPQLLSTLRVPLLRGRIFNDAECRRAAHLAMVNQAFVKQYLGDLDPLGQSVRSPQLKLEQPNLLSAQAPDGWLEVVGVVGDAKNAGLSHPVQPALFLPYSFVLTPDESLMVRSDGDPQMAIRSVKERLREINPEIVVARDHTLEWWLDTEGWGRERFIAMLFGLFATLALILAATGLYSVVSFVVSQRTQEFGIRMALGARRSSVVQLVLGSTAAMLGAGVLLGFLLSVILNRVVSSWGGGSSRDPLTLVGAAAILLFAAGIACILPAWRAGSIDPMRALRSE